MSMRLRGSSFVAAALIAIPSLAFAQAKGLDESDIMRLKSVGGVAMAPDGARVLADGLAFGADTNASTNFEETIYKLDLPNTDNETVDQSLLLLRETASNLTLDPGAIDRERGVVVSEERARDNPAYRVYKDRLTFLLKTRGGFRTH